jgi:transposase
VYTSDLDDEEWALLAPLIPPAKRRGRPRTIVIRRIFGAISCLLHTGCAWRYPPREYGPWQTSLWYCRQWRLDGIWTQMQARLRADRDPTPGAAISDSQSVETPMGGLRGFDGHKQVAGRKCHRPVDTEAFLLSVVVHAAHLPEPAAELGYNSGFRALPRCWVVERTQPQYLQCALDVQRSPSHDRTHWVAEPA